MSTLLRFRDIDDNVWERDSVHVQAMEGRNTRRIAGVVLRGAFYDKEGLERLLTDVRSAPDLRVDDWGRTAKR